MNDIVYEEQKQLIKMWKDKYYEKKEEIERLNNIISELEDYMIGKDIYKILLYKLRDLKENDKE